MRLVGVQRRSGIRCNWITAILLQVFVFSSRRRHTRSLCDWSSDVCSSDLIIYGDRERPGFWARQLRALALLILTIAPLLVAAILGVFGRPLRRLVGAELGKGTSVQTWWGVFFHGIAILLAMIAVTVIYRWARPRQHSLTSVLPGAMIATLLWWVADLAFGFYVRKMPYGIIYGGLAAVIGLLIWMELSTVIIFLGAAWNAELAASRKVVRAGA